MEIKTKQWADGSSATIQYDGQGDGNIIITSDANSLYEARSMQITVETTDGSGISRTITVNQAAKQRIDLSAAVVTAATQTYSGSAKTPIPTVTLNGSTVPSGGYDVAYSNNTNAGTATITITGKGDYTGTAYGTFTINKATPSYTAPATRSLTYSGSSQYLTTSGSTSHGTIYYSTNGVNWYTSRRTATTAGSYNCYWKLVGDSNHTDISSTYLGITTIAKASRTISWSSYPSSLYVGSNGTLSATASAGSSDGTISYSSSNSSKASVSGSTVTAVASGTCTIYASISEGTNYLSASTSYTLSVVALPYVDLGLPSGKKWAVGNLVKDSQGNYSIGDETDWGTYISWGNIDGHNEGEGYNFKSTNYNSTPGARVAANIPSNDAQHDICLAKLGSPWHLPTKEDFQELYDSTDSEWVADYNGTGVAGRKFMKKTDHSVYVFFPASGNYDNTSLNRRGSGGYYWSSSWYSSSSAYSLYFSSSYMNPHNNNDRYRGFTVRPVQ